GARRPRAAAARGRPPFLPRCAAAPSGWCSTRTSRCAGEGGHAVATERLVERDLRDQPHGAVGIQMAVRLEGAYGELGRGVEVPGRRSRPEAELAERALQPGHAVARVADVEPIGN